MHGLGHGRYSTQTNSAILKIPEKTSLRLITFGLTFAITQCVTAIAIAQVAFKQIALTGDQAGTNDGAEFEHFNYPTINSGGDVAFTAWLRTGRSDTPVIRDHNDANSNRIAIFGPTDGAGSALGLIIRENELADTNDGAEFSSFSGPSLNAVGDVAFRAELRSGPGGSPVITDFQDQNSNFLAIIGPTNGAGSALGLLARSNEPANVADGAKFYSFDRPVLNNAGDVAFEAGLRAGPNTTTPVTGLGASIFGPTDGAGSPLGLVVRRGSPTGVGDGSEFQGFGGIKLNELGEIAFRARLRTGSGGIPVITDPFDANSNDRSIFRSNSFPHQAISLIVREGAPAGTKDNAEFEHFYNPVFTDTGDVAFVALLRTGLESTPVITDRSDPNSNNFALFGPTSGVGSPAGLLAREDTLAGVADRAEFDYFGNPAINSRGDIAFLAGLRTGPGGVPVTTDNNDSLFARVDSELKLIVREGELFQVTTNGIAEERTIAHIGFFNDGLNDSSSLVFFLRFTDQTEGVFIADYVAIPEPTAAALIAIAALFMTSQRPWQSSI